MNKLQIFENKNFGKIRALEINNEPYFVAKDVCDILEIKNSRQALTRLDKDEKADVILNDGSQNRNMSTINEYGLYNLILASRKKEAKEFKRWITHEVIPSIRKNGGYIAGQENLTDEELIQKALLVAKKKLEEREKQLEEQKPKVLFANSVESSKTSILVGELAKIIKQSLSIELGQNRLFKWLRNNGYLVIRKGTDYNMPTQKSMDLGLFEIKESTIIHADGHVSITKTPKVTGKGQVYFIDKFYKDLEEKIYE